MNYVMLACLIIGLAAINYYIMNRMFALVKAVIPKANAVAYYIVCMIFVLFCMVGTTKGFIPFDNEVIKTAWTSVSARWLAMFIYLLTYFVITDIVFLVGQLIKKFPKPIPGKWRIITAGAVLVLSLLTVGLGEIHAYKVYIKNYDVPVKKEISQDLTIAMVSDIHLGAENSEERLPKIVEKINEINPDVVCIAGDIFDNDYSAIGDEEKAKEQLRSIKSKYGVYACLGNHDCGDDFDDMIAFLKDSNVILLNDECTEITDDIVLVGRVDPTPIGVYKTMDRKKYSDITQTLDKNKAIIVMEHNPDNTGEYGEETDLVLSGHTHYGQIFPGNILIRWMYGAKGYGESLLNNNTKLIVSSGAGTWGMPIRVGTDCEVLNIRVHN